MILVSILNLFRTKYVHFDYNSYIMQYIEILMNSVNTSKMQLMQIATIGTPSNIDFFSHFYVLNNLSAMIILISLYIISFMLI